MALSRPEVIITTMKAFVKAPFFGYYPPTDAEYERLWKEGLIVLDTNVLLNLYRLPTAAREELFSVLELLQDRLWIPHQVALEFQRRRLTVIATERKSTEEALQSASDWTAELKRKVDSLQIDKRGIGVDPKPLLEDLEKANSKLIEAISAVHQGQLDISSLDPIRERLDRLLNNRTGPGPSSQAELDALVLGGEERFKERIPPGFADADKDKNPNEATFIHGQLKFTRKFGDLILWRQLINHAKDSGFKCILLITADRKEDWWWREQGKTIGPHPALVREIVTQAKLDMYWMYSSVQFVEHANKYIAAKVSPQSVDELKMVALALPPDEIGARKFLQVNEGMITKMVGQTFQRIFRDDPANESEEDLAVARWITQTSGEVRVNQRGFPDYLIENESGKHGLELKRIRSMNSGAFSMIVRDTLMRGYVEMHEGRLSSFTVILLVPPSELGELENTSGQRGLEDRLANLLSRVPITGIVVGAIVSGEFRQGTYVAGRDYRAD